MASGTDPSIPESLSEHKLTEDLLLFTLSSEFTVTRPCDCQLLMMWIRVETDREES